MYLACSSITWGPLRREGGAYAGVEGYGRILDEIRDAGYTHTVAGVRRTLDADAGDPLARPQDQLRFLADHGLKPAPGYTGGYAFRDPAQTQAHVEAVKGVAAYTRALGLDAVYLGPESSASHNRTPGHYPTGGRPDRPTPDETKVMCDAINRMGEACRNEGVWLCPHNHSGMFWETDEEFEDVVNGTDPALVGMGPDVGHMVWGGIDPVAWFRRHMGRVKTIHIKDVDATVLQQVRDEKLTYREGSDRNIWVEIGSGCVDWPALFGIWRDTGFDGSVIVESDRTPLPTPKESVSRSREYIRRVGGI